VVRAKLGEGGRIARGRRLWGRVAAIDNQQRGEWCYVGGELSERDSLSAGAAGRVDAVVVGSCGRRVRASCVWTRT
jgi:hypothetical protein